MIVLIIKFEKFFSPKKILYLDVVYPYYKYIIIEQSKLFGCQHYEARKSSCEVFLTFLSILVRFYLNNVLFIYNELETYPGISNEQLNSFRNSGINLVYDLLLPFCACVNLEPS